MAPYKRANSSLQEKEMHDRKLLSGNDLESTEISGPVAPIAVHATGRTNSRANFWTIVCFCIAGLICSLLVPASYLNVEQTSVLLAETPLS